MQSLYGISIHNAVATSAGLGVPITIAGTIGYMLAGLPQQALMPPLSIGFVSLLGVAVMAPVSSFTAAYGARLAHAWPKRRLEIAFGLFLLAVAVRFVVSLVGDRLVGSGTKREDDATHNACGKSRSVVPYVVKLHACASMTPGTAVGNRPSFGV